MPHRRLLAAALLLSLLVQPAASRAGSLDHLLLSEIAYNPAQPGRDTLYEWFELHNAGGQAVDLNGWLLADAGSERHRIDQRTFPMMIRGHSFLMIWDIPI